MKKALSAIAVFFGFGSKLERDLTPEERLHANINKVADAGARKWAQVIASSTSMVEELFAPASPLAEALKGAPPIGDKTAAIKLFEGILASQIFTKILEEVLEQPYFWDEERDGKWDPYKGDLETRKASTFVGCQEYQPDRQSEIAAQMSGLDQRCLMHPKTGWYVCLEVTETEVGHLCARNGEKIPVYK